MQQRWRRQELVSDSKDSYNRAAPYILPLIFIYLSLAVLHLGGHLLYPNDTVGNNSDGTIPSVVSETLKLRHPSLFDCDSCAKMNINTSGVTCLFLIHPY